LNESSYDFAKRIALGQMTEAEASTELLKITTWRTKLFSMSNFDFETHYFGDAWINPVILPNSNENGTIQVENCKFDVEGGFIESYDPQNIILKDLTIDVTKHEYGLWISYTTCAEYNEQELYFENITFTGRPDQALFTFWYTSTIGNVILKDFTFVDLKWIDVEARPFINLQPKAECDIGSRSQEVSIDGALIDRLEDSNLMIAISFGNDFQGQKKFGITNSKVIGSKINKDLFRLSVGTGAVTPEIVFEGNEVEESIIDSNTAIYQLQTGSNDLSLVGGHILHT